MNESELRNFDLNLLLTLHVLLEERSVSRAASRLHLSQSAVSHALTRLREGFRDTLFVRGRHVMVPTARAEALAPLLRQFLGQAQMMLTPPVFDASLSSGIFRLALTDYGSLVILPELVRFLAVAAPNIMLEGHLWTDDTTRLLQNGSLDIGLGGQDPFDGLLWQPVFRDRLVFVVDHRHPLAQRRALTPGDIASFPHAVITVVASRMAVIDTELMRLGLSRQIKLKLPHFLAASAIIADSDLILTIPEVGARRLQQTAPIKILSIPLAVQDYDYKQFWGIKQDANPFHQWMRTTIQRCCERIA